MKLSQSMIRVLPPSLPLPRAIQVFSQLYFESALRANLRLGANSP